MKPHLFPETENDLPRIALKLDIRADDLAGLIKALAEVKANVAESLEDQSSGLSFISKPKRKKAGKLGRYSMHFVGEWAPAQS